MDAALATHCLDISEPKTLRGRMPAHRLYTARWALTDPSPTPTAHRALRLTRPAGPRPTQQTRPHPT
ncbi:hypothetical protein ACIPXV_38690 [Streptomyces libani]|uniref:hypothetical protein n=1 Tax=Streptomyces nigrescens TaxID=1920 RepID=UPI0037F1DEC3